MLSNIKDFCQKIKYFAEESKKELLSLVIIILVGFSSFGLGFLAGSGNDGAGFDQNIIRSSQSGSAFSGNSQDVNSGENNSVEVVEKQIPEADDGLNNQEVVVASKSGKKYHFPWCSGAKQIAEKNKITFNSIEEARDAGYTPASNCKGLK